MVYQFVLGKQAVIIKMMKKDGEHGPGTQKVARHYPPCLLLPPCGVTNICAPTFRFNTMIQVFEVYPQANIVVVDYDPGASKINQETESNS